MRIAICTPNVEHNDAVGNDVLGMHQIFYEEGYDCRVFAVNSFVDSIPVSQPEAVLSFLRDSEDVLIYHHSVGWDVGLDILKNVQCQKVIKYHNVTPSRFFKDIAHDYFVACESGRKHLAEMVRLKVDLFLADSAYNLQEIVDMASCRIDGAVVPPFHNIDQLQQIEADQQVLARFGDRGANFLMVGRIAPNKGFEYLIDVFKTYHVNYNPQSRLLIVGKANPALQSYYDDLEKKTREYGLSQSIFFTGEVSAEELKAYYQVSIAFTITSLHEGFCVPLVEAMSMKIPIAAYASSAIPETVGDVGFVWEEHDPEMMAASMNMIVENEVVKNGLGEMGRKRYQAVFSNNVIKMRLLSALDQAGMLRKETP